MLQLFSCNYFRARLRCGGQGPLLWHSYGCSVCFSEENSVPCPLVGIWQFAIVCEIYSSDTWVRNGFVCREWGKEGCSMFQLCTSQEFGLVSYFGSGAGWIGKQWGVYSACSHWQSHILPAVFWHENKYYVACLCKVGILGMYRM